MKITDIDCKLVHIPYRTPYRMAPGVSRTLKRVVVTISTDEGISGVGETGTTLPERGGETISPRWPRATGETRSMTRVV